MILINFIPPLRSATIQIEAFERKKFTHLRRLLSRPSKFSEKAENLSAHEHGGEFFCYFSCGKKSK